MESGLVAEDTEAAAKVSHHLGGVPVTTLELRRHGDGGTFLESLAHNSVPY